MTVHATLSSSRSSYADLGINKEPIMEEEHVTMQDDIVQGSTRDEMLENAISAPSNEDTANAQTTGNATAVTIGEESVIEQLELTVASHTIQENNDQESTNAQITEKTPATSSSNDLTIGQQAPADASENIIPEVAHVKTPEGNISLSTNAEPVLEQDHTALPGDNVQDSTNANIDGNTTIPDPTPTENTVTNQEKDNITSKPVSKPEHKGNNQSSQTELGIIGKQNEVIDCLELLNMPFAEPIEFVENIITEGLTLLAGKPKQGKSSIVNDLAISIATGEPAFGHYPVTQTEVAILTLETHPRRLQSDLRKMVTPDLTHSLKNIKVLFKWNPDTALYAGITRFIKENPKVKVIFIDTLARFLDMDGGTKAGYEKRYRVGSILKKIADDFNIAIVALIHLRKGNIGDNPVDSILGSSGMPAAADNIISLNRSKQTGITSVFVTGRNVNDKQFTLSFDEDTKHFQFADEHSEIKIGREANAILDKMHLVEGDIKLDELQLLVGKSKSATANHLKTLVKRGYVEKLSHGRYRVVPPPISPTIDTETVVQ